MPYLHRTLHRRRHILVPDFLTDIRNIALTITAVEGVCLVYLRRVVTFLEGRQTPVRMFVACLGAVYLGLAWLIPAGEPVLHRMRLAGFEMPAWMYFGLVWDFFFTLMVAFDVVLWYYAWRVLALVKRGSALPAGWIAVPLIAAVIIGYRACYASAIELYRTGALGASGLLALSDFFRRICGSLFVLIEGSVAVLGYSIIAGVGRLKESQIVAR